MDRAMRAHALDTHTINRAHFQSRIYDFLAIQFIYFFVASFQLSFSQYNTQRKTTKADSSDFEVLESYDNNINRVNTNIIYKLQNGQEER